MNLENETIVSSQMMKKLKEAGLDKSYALTPDEFQKEIGSFLNGRDIADMNDEIKKKLENKMIKSK